MILLTVVVLLDYTRAVFYAFVEAYLTALSNKNSLSWDVNLNSITVFSIELLARAVTLYVCSAKNATFILDD